MGGRTDFRAVCDPCRSHALPERKELEEFWAEIVWLGLCRAKTALERKQCRHLADRAAWAVTEIHADAEFKFFRQRYLSHGVRLLFEKAIKQEGRLSKSQLVKGLRHEHVWPRKFLVQEILAAKDRSMVLAALNRAVACVVTKDEELLHGLKRFGNGWDRYREAKLRVWDRENQRYLE